MLDIKISNSWTIDIDIMRFRQWGKFWGCIWWSSKHLKMFMKYVLSNVEDFQIDLIMFLPPYVKFLFDEPHP